MPRYKEIARLLTGNPGADVAALSRWLDDLRAALQIPRLREYGIRDADLDGLVEKHLVEQKIRELNIRVSEEEIRQSIEDVKRQNGMSQEALVAALAGQGLSFDQYRSQLQEQLEKLRRQQRT